MAVDVTHYVQGADTNHFLGRCEECDAHYLSGKTQEEVENWYHQGLISQDQWEAYMYVWATSAWKSERWDSWRQPPVIPAVIRIAAIMREILGARMRLRQRVIYLNGRRWTVVTDRAGARYVWCDPPAGRDYQPVITTAAQVTYGYRFDFYR